MIKKWSYVVATAATVFGGTFLTGCIDNDEPFGIEQIRVETANLLKAKQALVAADAAAKQAQAELDKANAEIAKVNAEVAKAKAEAEMKLAELEKQAEIARQEAQTAMDKAESEARVAVLEAQIADQKARTEAYINEQKAILDNLIAQNELSIKNSQLAYDQAVYQWELSKIQDALNASTPLWHQLNAAYATYLQELNDYNQKAQNLADLQRESAQWLNDLVYNEEKNMWEHPKEKYKNMLVDAINAQEQNVANAQNDINSLNQQIADFENIKTNNDVYTKWTELSEEIKDNNAKIAELNIQREEIELNNQPLLNEINTLKDASNEVGSKKIAIPAYTFEPSAAAQQLGIMQPEVIVPANTSYTLNDQTKYNEAQDAYRNKIGNLKNYLLDENDIAWTNAHLNEMQREMKPAQEAYDKAKAEWENAKKVYNMGNEPDASALPLESELEAAITAYNAFEGQISSAKEKLETAQNDLNEATKALDEALEKGTVYDQAVNARNSAKAAAYTAEREANEAAEKTKNQAIANAKVARDNAENAWRRAQLELSAIISEIEKNPDDESLEAQKKSAEDKETKAKAAYDKAQSDYADAEGEANKAYAKALATSHIACVEALHKADEDFDKAYAAWVAAGEVDSAIEALKNTQSEKQTAVTTASEEVEAVMKSLNEAWKSMDDAKQQQLDEIGLYNWSYNTIPSSWQIENYIYGWISEFPEATAPVKYISSTGVYLNAKNYLIQKSRTAYGSLGINCNGASHDWDYNGIEALEIDRAFLVDEITTDMLNAYVKNYVQKNYGWTPEDYQCIWYYNMLFGDFGTLKTLENRIEVAKANLENSDLVSSIIGTMQTNLDELIASIDPVKAEEAKAKEAYDAKQAQYNKLFSDIDSQIAALNHQNDLINNVIAAINQNFELLNDQNAANPEAVQNAIDDLKGDVADQQGVLAAAQKALKEAQDNLALLENGNAEYDYNPYTAQIDQLTAALEVSKDQLAAVKARLDEIQAKYEAAAQQ